jgi:hypothetical protein
MMRHGSQDMRDWAGARLRLYRGGGLGGAGWLAMGLLGACGPAWAGEATGDPTGKVMNVVRVGSGAGAGGWEGSGSWGAERQVTSGPGGRILTNAGVWSPDSEWIVYDTRSDPAGELFDGGRIQRVRVDTGEVQVLFEARDGACCGVATYHPHRDRVVFILGPAFPTPDWSYAPWHRGGQVVEVGTGQSWALDARELAAPYRSGALRGGTHLHLWDQGGEWVSFTYEDHILATAAAVEGGCDLNQRNVGVSVWGHPVRVGAGHVRNRDGEAFSVLVTKTENRPRPGSDEIRRACEEAWVGTNGYRRSDGGWQRRALAFQGEVVTRDGRVISEVYVVDLPDDLTAAGEGPLEGTVTRRPAPPKGVVQRRLTFTAARRHPGLQGSRHWVRSSPDGSRIAFLMKDDDGVVQIWTVSPTGGEPVQVTRNAESVCSAFTWSPDGRWIAHVMGGCVGVTQVTTGRFDPLTNRPVGFEAPRPEACVFSPDGRRIAYVRRVPSPDLPANQVFVVERESR